MAKGAVLSMRSFAFDMNIDQLTILLHRSEGDTLDFKSKEYPFPCASDNDKSELLKDILSLANAWKDSPAYIVIGVTEDHGRAVAFLGVRSHLPDHSLQQFVNARTNVPVRFQVETVSYEAVELDIICVAAQQARPIFLTKDYGRLKKNVVYVRRGSSTAEAAPDEIAEMGRSEAMTSNASVPSLVVEFAHPTKRERWGSTASIMCTELIDPPPPPPKKVSAVEQAARKANPLWGGQSLIEAMTPRVTVRTGPDPKEVLEYLKANARFAGVSFWVQNVGTVNASNVHIDVRITRQDGVTIASGYDRPRKPRAPFDIGIHREREPSIYVFEQENEHVMSLNIGTLQPKAEHWVAGDFIVAVSADCEIPALIRVFADHLANPIESTLLLKVSVNSRVYTLDDLGIR